MSYRNERFNRSMKSLDAMLSGYSDPSKAKVLGDGGKALEQLLDAIDYSPERKREQKRQLAANRLLSFISDPLALGLLQRDRRGGVGRAKDGDDAARHRGGEVVVVGVGVQRNLQPPLYDYAL